jgi:hypothetical protein
MTWTTAATDDLSRSEATFDPISTLVVAVEMSKTSWLVSGVVPGAERQPLEKLDSDATALLGLTKRWRSDAVRAGHRITRIAVAYGAGGGDFWLARWLIARGIEAHVIDSASVAIAPEDKRTKTVSLNAATLMRAFLGWLRGERGHCEMVAIPPMEEEDRHPSHEPYLTRRQGAEYIRQELGIPLSFSTAEKLGALGEFAQPAMWWGRRPLYTRDGLREWVAGRARPRPECFIAPAPPQTKNTDDPLPGGQSRTRFDTGARDRGEAEAQVARRGDTNLQDAGRKVRSPGRLIRATEKKYLAHDGNHSFDGCPTGNSAVQSPKGGS